MSVKQTVLQSYVYKKCFKVEKNFPVASKNTNQILTIRFSSAGLEEVLSSSLSVPQLQGGYSSSVQGFNITRPPLQYL